MAEEKILTVTPLNYVVLDNDYVVSDTDYVVGSEFCVARYKDYIADLPFLDHGDPII